MRRFIRTIALALLCATTYAVAQEPLQTTQKNTEDLLRSSKNGHLSEHAYVLLASVWVKPSIYVCWENPSPQFQREMGLVQEEVTKTWEHESQLRFTGWQKCATENKGIRILIDDSGPHTIGLGRELDGIKNGMVLNFTFAKWSPSCQQTRDYCVKAIAGHEFGHAIGFAHEQNRPDTPGECREAPQGKNGDKLLTPYDEHSIMNYCNSKWNNEAKLSSLDIDAVHQLYGAPSKTSAHVAAQPSSDVAFLNYCDFVEEEKRNSYLEHPCWADAGRSITAGARRER